MVEFVTRMRKTSRPRFGALEIATTAALLSLCLLYYRNSLTPGLRNIPEQIIENLFILFASIALFAIYSALANRLRLSRALASPYLVIACAALLFGSVYKLCMHQFGGNDEGMVVNYAAHYADGLKPYIDFPSSVPPLLLAGVRTSLLLFGLRWAGIALLTAGYASLTCLWIYWLFRRAAVAPHWAPVLTITVEACTMFLCPFWWYNNTSSVSVILLLLSVLACMEQRKSFIPWISLSVSLGMVITAKPNVAPASLMVLALFVTKTKMRWAATAVACAGALAVAYSICQLALTPPILLLGSYAEVAKLRGSPLLMIPFRQLPLFDRWVQFALTVLLALSFVTLLIRSVQYGGRSLRVLAVCSIAALTGLEMACTNAEWELTNLIVIFVPTAFLCLGPWSNREMSTNGRRLLTGLSTVFLVMSGYFGITHLRIRTIGERMFYEPLPTQTITGGYLAGMAAGPRLLRIQQQIETVLTRYPSKSVFFGPRMEFEYAVFDKPVMPKMPLIWSPGNLFSPQRLPGLVAEFQRQDPELLIFLKDDYTFMGPVADYIRTTPAYERIDDFQELTVYVRKRQAPETDRRRGTSPVDHRVGL